MRIGQMANIFESLSGKYPSSYHVTRVQRLGRKRAGRTVGRKDLKGRIGMA